MERRPLVGLLCEALYEGRLAAFGSAPEATATHARLLSDVHALARHLDAHRLNTRIVHLKEAL